MYILMSYVSKVYLAGSMIKFDTKLNKCILKGRAQRKHFFSIPKIVVIIAVNVIIEEAN